jgi:hypothetical protein
MNETNPKSNTRRLVVITLALLLLLAGASTIVGPMLIDAERFRPRIERAIEEQTGWEATLGKIELSIWRGRLVVKPASLRAPDAESSELTIKRIEVNAKLLPLLSKRLEIEQLLFFEADVTLARADESSGWIIPIKTKAAQATSAPSSRSGVQLAAQTTESSSDVTEGANGAKANSNFAVEIAEIGIRNGTITIDDRAVDPPLSLRLENVNGSYFLEDGGLEGDFDFVDGEGSASWRGQIGRTVEVTLKGLKTELLHPFIGTSLVHGGGALSGEVTISTPLKIIGALDADGLVLLSGQEPFERATIDFELAPDDLGWNLDTFTFQAGPAQVVGGGRLTPTIDLDLELPKIDLEAAVVASKSVLPLPVDVEAPGHVSALIEIDQPLGGELSYAARGELAAAVVRSGDLLPEAQDLVATYNLSRQGRLDVKIDQGTMADGSATGSAWIDPIYPAGQLRFKGGLQSAVFGKLLGGLVAQAKEVTGPTGFDANLGIALDHAVLDARSLSGTIDFDARELLVPGWDLESAIRKSVNEKLSSGAVSLLEGLLNKDKKKDAAAEAAAEVTPAIEAVAHLIDEMKGRINFDSFPWQMESVVLAVGDVESTGGGSFNPEDGAVDFRLDAFLSAAETQKLVKKNKILRGLVGGDGRLKLPVRVRGLMAAPKIEVDVSRALKKGDSKSLLRGLLGDD